MGRETQTAYKAQLWDESEQQDKALWPALMQNCQIPVFSIVSYLVVFCKRQLMALFDLFSFRDYLQQVRP